MQKNNLLVGIAILLAATACTQGRYLGVDADDIARTAEGHHGSDAWATNKKKDDFLPGTNKCNKFVYDVLREAGATAPKQPSGLWPLKAQDWANAMKTIPDWSYKGTNVTCERGDVLSDGVHCGFAVSSNMVISATFQRVTRDSKSTVMDTPAVRRYTGS